ncbi:hypothetical protein [Tropicibacter naphthalenivorans]|uniref:Hydrogenase expression/formation protein HupK n=1 Tax=Tropicibacter naphthalenivorans TaxID=441103 RepID=A0A0P1GI60_9RHOB|nr:hypothetical protein [Tropicibacter naphthalenivorans]CUH75912.1 hypothetical protein TRN7648_00688 [Tropicibacter naphthalenivorans]SMC41389.1 hypothetical protein SAMN04488093_101196 [Tropicibacter naphthalenivorans]
MLDRPDISLRAIAPTPLPVGDLVRGKPAEHVADLVPRLFNLCRAAQIVGVRMALGLPIPDGVDLSADIRREHVMRLAVMLPSRLGLDRIGLPIDWSASQTEALIGPDGFPATPEAFDRYLDSDTGIAPLLRTIASRFAPGEACTNALPTAQGGTTLNGAAQENSVAMRHLDHPVMVWIEDTYGRGPLWRTAARAIDLQAAEEGRLPAPELLAPGCAIVPAARGSYAIEARTDNRGRVLALRRVTPTDHLLAQGGIMDQSLASLPRAKHDQALLLVDILDPCTPLKLEEPTHA